MEDEIEVPTKTSEPAPEPTDEIVSLKGEIIDISRRFWAEGWGFGKIRALSGSKEPIRITGILEGFKVGMHVSIVGRYHSGKYGTELKIETIMGEDPGDMRGVRQWLIDRIPQIGPYRAGHIAERFGERIWEILETEPYLLLEVSGLTTGRVDEIVRVYGDYKKEREKYVPFYDLGLTQREARAADKAGLLPEQIVADPFLLYLHLDIVSFARNEIIADKAKASRLAQSRLIAAAIQTLKDLAYDGHTAADEEYVVEHAAALATVPWIRARDGVIAALELGFLVPDVDGMIMLSKYAKAEGGIADKIEQLLQPRPEAHGRDHTGPDPGRSGEDDAHREGGRGDGWTGNGEEHDPGDLPGEGDPFAEGGAVRADWEGGEEDR